MVRFTASEKVIILEYSPDEPFDWIATRLNTDKEVPIKHIFHFNNEDLLEINDLNNTVKFNLAELDVTGKYFHIFGRKLDIPNSIYFEKGIQLSMKYFLAATNISIFKRIARIVSYDIIIGSGEDANLNASTFKKLINGFPTTTEIKKYADMRVSTIINEELAGKVDSIDLYNKYMKNKTGKQNFLDIKSISSFETDKYKAITENFKIKLEEQDKYIESQWQAEILDIIKLIFPKYISVLREIPIKNVYDEQVKRLDFLLVDYTGHIDIIEIKRPNDANIISNYAYRDNYPPSHELSRTIMQTEKYLFFLNRWGIDGDNKLTEINRKRNGIDINIKIVNPRGIIIMGRDRDLNPDQIRDFEIIKRKYKNIADIITYDDLLQRLDRLVSKFSIMSKLSD
jgi:hypothetical protein